jgi:hypothetical protein
MEQLISGTKSQSRFLFQEKQPNSRVVQPNNWNKDAKKQHKDKKVTELPEAIQNNRTAARLYTWELPQHKQVKCIKKNKFVRLQSPAKQLHIDYYK